MSAVATAPKVGRVAAPAVLSAAALAKVEASREGSVPNAPWPVVRLGEIAEFIMGQAPPGEASNFDGHGTIFVKAGEFGPLHPVVREWTTKPLRYAKGGDVLICVVGATAGKLNLGIDCAIGRSVSSIRPNAQTFDRFVYLQLLPKVLTLRAGSTGSAQGVINRDMLANIEIVLPPLPEQRRIVAEIEKQFTRLDAAVAALKRTQANLKRYRAAVLKAACEGRLVPTEAELARAKPCILGSIPKGAKSKVSGLTPLGSTVDPGSTSDVSQLGRNVRDVEVASSKAQNEGSTPYGCATSDFESGAILLDRILAERRKSWQGRGSYIAPTEPDTANLPPYLPEGWACASIDQITKNFDGRRIPLKSADRDKRPGQYPYYGASGVIDDIDDFLFDGEYLLIAEDGANLLSRSTPIAFKATGKFWVNNHAHIVQTHGGIPLAYLSIFLNGKDLSFSVTGSAQPKLTQAALNKIPVPLPPLAEQTRIVAEVERRLSGVEELETVVNANLQRAIGLRQSILHRIFTNRRFFSR